MSFTTAITAGTAVLSARQASASAQYNQAIQNRNARVMMQRAEAIEQKKQLDLAKFDRQFQAFQGETKVAIAKTGAERSGSALRILRNNVEQAEFEKDMIDYNAEIGKSQAFEQANFATMQGELAKQQGRAAAIGYYGEAASILAPYGKSLLSGETTPSIDLTLTEGSF